KLTEVIALAGDVTDAAHRQAPAEAGQSACGLDALVNNASMIGPSPQPNLLDYPLDVLQHVYRTDVTAPHPLLHARRYVMHPGEDISDRPLAEVSVPGLIELLTGKRASGRYAARALAEDKQLDTAR